MLITSSTKFLWAAQEKRFKKSQKKRFRLHQYVQESIFYLCVEFPHSLTPPHPKLLKFIKENSLPLSEESRVF